MKKMNLLLSSLAVFTLALTGCKKDDNKDSNNSSVTPSSDSVTPSDDSSKVEAVLADGLFSYSWYDYDQKTEIMGILEKYAVENNLTGLTIFEDSGYQLINPRIQKGTNTYIVGYGFGTLSEGNITEDLAAESNSAWKKYYHSYESSDPGHINYMNDKGSVVGDLIGYHSESYWGTKMNETKDGYEWYSALAKEKPVAVNADNHNLATTYKFHVKTGDDGFVYNTLSTTFSKYAGRKVTLEDYITPYKLYYTQANNYARGSENLSGASSIAGSAEYYSASKDGFNEKAWENVGIEAGTDEGGAYLQFTFNVACNSFYAMYYLASSMFAPVPQEFIDEIGGPSVWGAFDSKKGYTPVDTSLSTGPYVLEDWQTDKQIVFKKNDKWFDKASGRYQIEGVHLQVLKAISTDKEAALKEFLAGTIDGCGIPSTKLDEYKNDPRAVKVASGSTFKLNYNTCTQEEWNKLFGEDGTVSQCSEEDYWECEPAMSNDSFVKGLSYAFNRSEFCDTLGANPSLDWLGSAYLSDPENGVSYSSTEAHKNAISSLTEGAEDTFGYNLEIARAYFKTAAEELLASGAYKEGDTIEIQLAWMYESNFETYGNPLIKYFETAFNDPSVCGNKLTLKVTNWAGAEWSDVYYNKMLVGQFDIGFGSISGNSLNPLNFFEVLKSDNSSGFTLNWGSDTGTPDGTIVYDGKIWSFDALWQASDSAVYVKEGKVQSTYAASLTDEEPVLNADGSVTLKVATDMVNLTTDSGKIETKVTDVMICNYAASSNAEYFEDSVTYVLGDDGVLTVTVSAELMEKYKVLPYMGIDVYFTTSLAGVSSKACVSVYPTDPAFVAPAEEAE